MGSYFPSSSLLDSAGGSNHGFAAKNYAQKSNNTSNISSSENQRKLAEGISALDFTNDKNNQTEAAVAAWLEGAAGPAGQYLKSDDFNFFKNITKHLVRHAAKLQDKNTNAG